MSWGLRSARMGVLWLVMAVMLAACGRHQATVVGAVALEITHQVDGQALQLHEAQYPTPQGERFSVDKLRYYLSNFRLHRRDGQWFVPAVDAQSSKGYYLVDAADPASLRFRIEAVPPGDYDGIEFLVGVDEARNHAGVQSGTLDPAQGLFWTCKSGYIFLQLEGHSPQSGADDHALTYHLGSVDAQDRARSVYLPLAPSVAKVSERIEPEIHLYVDLAELFRGAHEIRIAQLNTVMGSSAGKTLSDNLPGLFHVDHVHNEPRHRAHDS